MSYDPIARGPHPVGVRSVVLCDEARGARRLPVELWYPAADSVQGRDLTGSTSDRYELLPGVPGMAAAWQSAVRDAPSRDQARPLVVFSHGFGAHRRQSTFVCTHLASHGYLVAAPEHLGNALTDVARTVQQALAAGQPPELYAELGQVISTRPADLSFVISELTARRLDGIPPVAADVDGVGVCGHSFGGWTALATAGRDEQVAAAVALAPAGGRSTLPDQALVAALAAESARAVPLLVVAAARDSLLPLDGLKQLFGQLLPPKRLLVLEQTDHMHFCDYPRATHEMLRRMLDHPLAEQVAPLLLSAPLPPFSELCPEAGVLAGVRGLALAHFDAILQADVAASDWLRDDALAALGDQGVRARPG